MFFFSKEEDALAAMKRRDEDIEQQLSEAIGNKVSLLWIW